MRDVTLRRWTEHDLPVLRRGNTPEMTEFLGGPESDEQLEKRHAKFLRLWETGEARMYTVTVPEADVPVGSVGYWLTTHGRPRSTRRAGASPHRSRAAASRSPL